MTANVIETIDSLAELKAYCCPKVAHVKEWYLKCIDCKQRKDCTVGRRAFELMNRDTRPAKTEPKLKAKSTVGLSPEENRQAAIERFLEALKQPDPADWYSKTYGVDRKIATNRIAEWKRRYPEVYREYAPETEEKRDIRVYNKRLTEEARKKAEEIFRADNMISVAMANLDCDRAQAMVTLHRWMRTYPDLVEKYNVGPKYNAEKYSTVRKRKETDPMVNKPATDEVSVKDFLKEQEAKTPKPEGKWVRQDIPQQLQREYKGPILKTETTGPIQPRTGGSAEIAARIPPRPVGQEDKGDLLMQEVRKKQEEIKKEIDYLEQEIRLRREHLQVLTRTLYILTGKIQ